MKNISDLSREFTEELFSTGILDKSVFGELEYVHIGRHMTSIEYSNVFKHYELLLADIIEVQLSEQQEQLFRNIRKTKSSKYRFVNADEIKSLGVRFGTDELTDSIANHTFKIINENSDKFKMRNKQKAPIKIQF